MKWKDIKETEGKNRKRWEDDLNLYDYKKSKKFERIRLVLDPIIAYRHWITVRTQAGKTVSVPVTCPRHDPVTNTFNKKVKCTACDMLFEINGMKNQKKAEALKKRLRSSRVYYSKAIIRALQKKGKKYVRNVRLTSLTSSDLLDLMDLALTMIKEKYGKKVALAAEKAEDVGHPKYGFDFLIKYNPNSKTPASAYSVQFVGVTPLTKKELTAVGTKSLNPKVIRATQNENIIELLAKGGLLKGSVGSDKEDSEDIPDFSDVDFDEMDKDEMIEFIEDNELEDEFPLKKIKKYPEKKLRRLLEAYVESLDEKEEDEEEDEEEEEGENENEDNEEPDFDEMDKDELLEFADDNEIKVPKKYKKSTKTLKAFIAKKWEKMVEEDEDEKGDEDDEGDDDFFEDEGGEDEEDEEDEEESPDFDEMDKKELLTFAKENRIRLKKSDATTLKKLRAKIKSEYTEEDSETFWQDED